MSNTMQANGNEKTQVQPRLVVTAEAEDGAFDQLTLDHWKEEGFDVTYLPFSGKSSKETLKKAMQDVANELEDGQEFAIIAFGKPASAALALVSEPIHKLCALVVYYSDTAPTPETKLHSGLEVLVHLARAPNATVGLRHYVYPEVEVGFAEAHRPTYDKVAAGTAWSRTLATLRKAFRIEVDLERIWENHLALEFVTKDADATMSTMVDEPYVNHIPTMTGGIGYKDLHRFYRDYFIPGNPPSLKIKLLSRTVGTDRVVDEMHMSFKHTQVIPWLLPDVEATNKDVEVAGVVIVCIRGGKLYHEHIYWDQASVLVQIGLLDPKLVPHRTSTARLPVVDGASARKVMDESSVRSNELISTW
ncbi:hypothetical protein ACLMJK_007855 [Lecanora helva]